MVSEFSIVSELKDIREQKLRLSQEEARLSRPKLTDLTLIPTLFSWFCEYSGYHGLPEKQVRVKFYQKFIFIILFLYSPGTLAGKKIAEGIRGVLAEVFGFKSPTGVSNLSVDVVFLYDNYKEYRADVDYLYGRIMDRLEVDGLIG